MGVMQCGRSGCTNILCELLVEDIDYICKSCAEEFISKQPVERMEHNDLTAEFKKFLQTPHTRGYSKLMTAHEFIHRGETHGYYSPIV